MLLAYPPLGPPSFSTEQHPAFKPQDVPEPVSGRHWPELRGQAQGCSDTQQLGWNPFNPNQKPVQIQLHATLKKVGEGW